MKLNANKWKLCPQRTQILYSKFLAVYVILLFLNTVAYTQNSDLKEQSKQFYSEAIKKYNAKDLEGALSLYTKAIGFDGQNAKAFRNRGVVYLELFEYPKAIDDLSYALELNKDDTLCYYFRAKAQRRRMNYNDAILDLDQAIKLSPNDADFYSDRGLCKYDLHNYIEALADLNKSIELDTHEISAYINRGMVKVAMKNYIGAIEDYSKALQLRPEIPSVICDRGMAHIQSGNAQDGCADLIKAETLGFGRAKELKTKHCK